MDITNVNQGGIVIGDAEYDAALLTHAGAGTIAAGTILGRITASGKFVVYASGASDGSEIPVAVLTIDSVATGAGDLAIRPLIGGRVKTSKIIDPNTSTVPTKAVQDAIRSYGIVCIDTDEINIQDNQ